MNQQPSRIGYVRYVGVWEAASISAIMAVGVGVLLLLGVIFQATGRQVSLLYFLSLLGFLPILLAYLERVSVRRRQNLNSLYSLLPVDTNVQLGFLNAWLLLGGLLTLGAVLSWLAAVHVDRLLADLLAIEADQRLLALFLIGLMVVNQLLGTNANWRARSVVLLAAVALVVGLVVAAFTNPSPTIAGFALVADRGINPGVLPLAVALWGIGFFIERRHLLQPGNRVRVIAPLLSYVAAAALGAGLGAVLLRFPRMALEENLPLLSLANSVHPLLMLALGILLVLIALLALNQTVASATRLAGQMTEDGLLPGLLDPVTTGRTASGWLPLLIGLLIIPLVLFLPFQLNMGLAVAGFLGATVLIHTMSVFKARSTLTDERSLRLPFTPLVPFLAAAISLTLILLQPLTNLGALSLWLVAGELFYLFYARRTAIDTRQAEEIVVESADIPEKRGHRVIACVSNPETAASLVRLGVEMAVAEGGDLLVLNVVTTSDQTTAARNQAAALAQEQSLQRVVAAIPDPPVPVTTLVRLAPSVDEGIQATVWEVQADAIVLGWPVASTPASIATESVAEAVVRRSRTEVVTAHGLYPGNPTRIMVPMTSYAHAPAALALGQALASRSGGEVVAMTLVRQKLTPALQGDLERRLQEQVAKLPDSSHVSTQVVQITDMVEDVAALAAAYDLVLLGMSEEGLMANTRFWGVPASAAEASTTPALLVKSEEAEAQFWLRRGWERLAAVLPTIDARQRSEVYLSMRRGARATVDFYVLIILSAAIAFFGLIQNSGAVIIGAMLVAPLMSPIMALAHGVVRGNVTMLRQALDSTARGATMAVVVATLLTFLLLVFGFPMTPTSEILSRTQPGIPDLIVALASGVAAAYALSRSEVAAALPGVSIAVALVPPLAVVGYGLGTLQLDIASGSLLLFATNLAAIVVAGAITFLMLGFRPPSRAERDDQSRYGLRVAVLAMVLITIPLLYATIAGNAQTRRDSEIRKTVNTYWLPSQAEVGELTIERERRAIIVGFIVYDFTGQIDDADLIRLREQLMAGSRQEVTLDARVVLTNRQMVDGQTTPVPASTAEPTPSALPPASPTALPPDP